MHKFTVLIFCFKKLIVITIVNYLGEIYNKKIQIAIDTKS